MKSQDLGMIVFLSILLLLLPAAKLSAVIFIKTVNAFRRLRFKTRRRDGDGGSDGYILRPF